MASAALKLVKDQTLIVTSGLVAGEWRQQKDGKVFPVYEPSSGEVLQSCANLEHEDFLDAIQSAVQGTENLRRKTAKQRAEMLRAWYDLTIANKDDLATILSLENGKTFAEASGEIVYAASQISWFSEEATRSYGDVIPSSFTDSTVITYKEPVGVCGLITPWNFPAAMITRKVAPALAAGCSAILKPASETPFTALALAKLAIDAGVPTDALHVLPTTDREASMELVRNPAVKKISFTGSTRVGKILTKVAADTMKRVSMELGGNAAFIVFEDADIDKAVEGAMICKFRCSGQTCVCANRLLVHKNVLDTFTTKLTAKVNALRLGRGVDDGTTQGPVVNAAAVEKVDSHVKDALCKGAVIHTGGERLENSPGFFYKPTVLTGVTPDMQVATDETFGPLAAIFSFTTEDEAVELANTTEFGLAGYFYSKDMGRIMRVSQRLECGMVGVNTGLISAAEVPFGGVKESGMGREGSKYGLAEYQNIKAVTIKY